MLFPLCLMFGPVISPMQSKKKKKSENIAMLNNTQRPQRLFYSITSSLNPSFHPLACSTLGRGSGLRASPP